MITSAKPIQRLKACHNQPEMEEEEEHQLAMILQTVHEKGLSLVLEPPIQTTSHNKFLCVVCARTGSFIFLGNKRSYL
jgi:hypothetical protein